MMLRFSSRRVLPLCAAFAVSFAVPIHAQDEADPSPSDATSIDQNQEVDAGKLRDIVAVDADALPDLPALLGRYPTALTIKVARAQLQPVPAWPRLRDWVQKGGIVFLHNDAAQLFGYGTIAARPATREMAGQLFGRAVAAWPWGAQPLLNGPRPVETVFYQIQEGDHLVNALNGATPLLRVTDLADLDAGAPDAPPLFASAIMPFGRGWAVFVPQLVETHRAEGAIFSVQLWQLATERSAAPTAPPDEAAAENAPPKKLPQIYLAVDADVFAAALPTKAQREGDAPPTSPTGVDFVALQKHLDALLEPPADERERIMAPPKPDAAPIAGAAKVKAPMLMLPSEEVDALAQLAHDAASPQAMPELRARALARLEIWRARWEMLQPQGGAALGWLDAAAQQVTPPEAAAEKVADEDEDAPPERFGVAFWRGVLASAPALDVFIDARRHGYLAREELRYLEPGRAQLWQDVADAWQLVVRARPRQLFALTAVQRDWLQNWLMEANRRAILIDLYPAYRYMQGEPGLPLMFAFDYGVASQSRPVWGKPDMWLHIWLGRSFGTNNWGWNRNLNRYSENYTIPGVLLGTTLTAASRAMGWRADREEVLLFPNFDTYRRFRNALGRTAQLRLPAAGIDSLLDNESMRLYNPDPLGNVVGQQLHLTHPTSTERWLQPTLNDAQGRPRQYSLSPTAGTGTPSVAGWMHAQALINALAEGGTSVPSWMRDGLGALSSYETMKAADLQASIESASDTAARAFLARQGNLMSPRDYVALSRKINTGSPIDTIATAQSMRMMKFFYDRFGTGAVVETLQRLGAGQSIDAALNATTGLNQNAFFTAWRVAESTAR